MKVVFFASDKSREHMLANCMAQAARQAGDEFIIARTGDYGEERKHEGPLPGTDVAIVFGVKGKSREIIEDHRMLRIATIYLDKGISRMKGRGGHTEYTRTIINGPSPSSYMMTRKFKSDRVKELGWGLEERREGGDYVLFLGSSGKYHDFHNLPPAQAYAEGVVKRLTKLTRLPVVYRPKPSDRAARPIANSLFSSGATDFTQALSRARTVVTHGSSAGVFAILYGIPVIGLGDSILSPVAESDLEKIDDPFWPEDDWRSRWANSVSYCQWTTDELEDGRAWAFLKNEIERQNASDVPPSPAV